MVMRKHVFVDKTHRERGVIHTCLCVQVLIYIFQIKKYKNTLIFGYWDRFLRIFYIDLSLYCLKHTNQMYYS